MTAYLLMPLFAFLSSIFFFLPSEVVLLVLANMNKMPVEMFGRSVDLAKYGTHFPWLLPVVGALGSNVGSSIYYFMGRGALKMSDRIKQKMEKFDIGRSGKARDAVVMVSCLTSIPPVSVMCVASGMIKMNFPRFFIITFIGKNIRYYLVLLAGGLAIDSLLRLLT